MAEVKPEEKVKRIKKLIEEYKSITPAEEQEKIRKMIEEAQKVFEEVTPKEEPYPPLPIDVGYYLMTREDNELRGLEKLYPAL